MRRDAETEDRGAFDADICKLEDGVAALRDDAVLDRGTRWDTGLAGVQETASVIKVSLDEIIVTEANLVAGEKANAIRGRNGEV